MPKDFRNSTRHHCPLRNGSKGNCRRLNGYCSAHQIKCLIHTTVHLLGEPCQDCESAAEAAERRAAEADAPMDTKDEKPSKNKNKRIKR
ncbi:hypothetical protein F4815DRAFT_441663 [Daldinia loculata]|uniref:uncharacterized protein n=1 Tax=Daldinia loculata TaxID=103429 RepID=UPI0020C2ABBF|nr:uncharacterized protein F4817DRAFT_311079 [Daldinia loculata]KAI1652198.1 hypothetical protein F4817DRAFT_311079 [Daldinia loculata]KAI2784007.1 hypothetical protein F4815DRAFT_441663 [Daldinia loculata]